MLNHVSSTRKVNGGQAILLFALAFVLMAGVLGLVLDGGRLYYERNRVQMAADSGAIAGVQELRRGYSGASTGFTNRVIDDVELHGVNADNSTIAVYNPPSSTSAHAGDGLYVEVKVEREVPTTFMRIFGPKYSTVSARSVAGLERAGDPCIIVLDEDDPDAFKTNGSISLIADCGVMVNSNAPSYAARNTGSGCISVTWFGVTGGFDGSCVSPTPKTGLTRVIDPLANLAAPAKPSSAGNTYTFTNSDGETIKAFTPGYYNNELKVTNGDVNAYFFPGLYYLEKGMKITGARVYGVGVMFYNNSTNGNQFIDISSSDRVIFTAPSSGSYRGMLFFSNRNAPYGNPGNKVARGTLDSYFSGAHYFPSQHLDWAGNPDSEIHWAMVISKTLNISGTASVNVRVNKPTKDQAPPSYAAVMFE
jgi:hypothetical protein